jgi:hypothetical protein
MIMTIAMTTTTIIIIIIIIIIMRYDYITKLCRKQACVIQNNLNPNVRTYNWTRRSHA